MGRNRGGGYHGTYCDCKRCTNRRNRAWQQHNQEMEDLRSSAGLVGDIAMGVSAVTGLVTNPGQQPDTNSMADIHQSQVEGYRDAIDEASDQRSPGTNQRY